MKKMTNEQKRQEQFKNFKALKKAGAYKEKVRADHGLHRTVYENNRKRILEMYNTCAICGRPVDKTLKYPDPMSAVVDHIIPIAKGGHPSDISNLQLAHNICNNQKAAQFMMKRAEIGEEQLTSNRDLLQSRDWSHFRSEG